MVDEVGSDGVTVNSNEIDSDVVGMLLLLDISFSKQDDQMLSFLVPLKGIKRKEERGVVEDPCARMRTRTRYLCESTPTVLFCYYHHHHRITTRSTRRRSVNPLFHKFANSSFLHSKSIWHSSTAE